jgi:hypothetical protein
MTVIWLPGGAVPDDPPVEPVEEHAVATSSATSATMEKDLVERAIDTPPREDSYSTAPAGGAAGQSISLAWSGALGDST